MMRNSTSHMPPSPADHFGAAYRASSSEFSTNLMTSKGESSSVCGTTHLFFQITNLSPIDLVLDRALVDVWFGQPTFSVALLHRYSVPAGEITHGIHIRYMLADNQKAQIQAFDAAPGSKAGFHIYISAYFESKLGRFLVYRSIERDRL